MTTKQVVDSGQTISSPLWRNTWYLHFDKFHLRTHNKADKSVKNNAMREILLR